MSLPDAHSKQRLYIKHLCILNIFSMIRFFLYLDSLEIRKYYRYLMHCKLSDIAKTLKILFLKLSPLYKYALNSKFIVVALVNKKSNICGLCHIDVNLKKQEGRYGIVILPFLQGKGLGKLLSIYTILYVFRTLREVKTIKLQVDVDNTNAIRLYSKLGFTIFAFNPSCDKRGKTWIACYEMILTKKTFIRMCSSLLRKSSKSPLNVKIR